MASTGKAYIKEKGLGFRVIILSSFLLYFLFLVVNGAWGLSAVTPNCKDSIRKYFRILIVIGVMGTTLIATYVMCKFSCYEVMDLGPQKVGAFSTTTKELMPKWLLLFGVGICITALVCHAKINSAGSECYTPIFKNFNSAGIAFSSIFLTVLIVVFIIKVKEEVESRETKAVPQLENLQPDQVAKLADDIDYINKNKAKLEELKTLANTQAFYDKTSADRKQVEDQIAKLTELLAKKLPPELPNASPLKRGITGAQTTPATPAPNRTLKSNRYAGASILKRGPNKTESKRFNQSTVAPRQLNIPSPEADSESGSDSESETPSDDQQKMRDIAERMYNPRPPTPQTRSKPPGRFRQFVDNQRTKRNMGTKTVSIANLPPNSGVKQEPPISPPSLEPGTDSNPPSPKRNSPKFFPDEKHDDNTTGDDFTLDQLQNEIDNIDIHAPLRRTPVVPATPAPSSSQVRLPPPVSAPKKNAVE